MRDYASLEALRWLEIPVWVFNPWKKKLSWANPEALRFWGCASERELFERDFSDTTQAAQIRLENVLRRSQSGECPTERWTLYPRGVPTEVRLQNTCVRAPSGDLEILFVANNIAANEMQADEYTQVGVEALRHSILMKIAIYREGLPNPILTNPTAEMSFDKGVDVLGLFVSPKDREEIRKELASGRTFSGDALMNTLEGPVWHRVDLRKMLHPKTGEPVINLNAIDITHQVAAENQRAQAEKERESLLIERDELKESQIRQLSKEKAEADAAKKEAIEAKRMFISFASHEIKTPLQGILGITELLRLEADRRKRTSDLVERLVRLTDMLVGIADDLGEFMRADHGHIEIERKPLDIKMVLLDVLESFRMQILEKTNSDGCFYIDNDFVITAPIVMGDETKLKQIFSNILSNAIKYTQKGGVKVACTSVRVSDDQARLTVIFEDTGSGVHGDDLPRITQPFVRGRNITGKKGLGLGLAIVKKYIEAMGGTISISSTVGVGTKVTLTWISQVSYERPIVRRPRDISDCALVHVLVIEDDEVTRSVFSEILSKFKNVRFDVSDSGEDGLEKMSQKSFDFALIDIRLPGISGFEVAKRARMVSDNPKIIRIGMSAHEVAPNGFDSFLKKPISGRSLALAMGLDPRLFNFCPSGGF